VTRDILDAPVTPMPADYLAVGSITERLNQLMNADPRHDFLATKWRILRDRAQINVGDNLTGMQFTLTIERRNPDAVSDQT
jgi:hypothetical protein